MDKDELAEKITKDIMKSINRKMNRIGIVSVVLTILLILLNI